MTLVSKLGIGLAVLLACLITGGFAGYKMGKAVQNETDASSIKSLTEQRDAAQTDAKNFSSDLAAVNAQAERDKATAAAQEARAAELQTQLDKSTAQSKKDLATWDSKLNAAAKTSTCSVLQETLCDSVMDY